MLSTNNLGNNLSLDYCPNKQMMMKIISTIVVLVLINATSFGQVVMGPKGTKITVDTSKWKFAGDDIYNKNIGKIGLGTNNPTAKLHTNGTIRFEGIGTNTSNSKLLTADVDGNITTRSISSLIAGNAIASVNGLTNSIQDFQVSTSGTDFSISSVGSTHVFGLPNASATNRGALSASDWSTFSGKENALTFANGLSRNINTITVNTTQNINTLSNLTSNGLIKTSGGTGSLSIATAGTDYTAGTSSLGTGILKTTSGTGALSIATASDFPIFNQNTTGNAATVTTNANLTGPITSLGNTTSVTANAISNTMLSQIASQTFKGRVAAGTGDVEDLTATQATGMLNAFTATAKGLVPASGGGTSTFLRADGAFATPNGSGRNVVTLAGDITNSNATANTLQDVTGLSFDVLAGVSYRFYGIIPYTSASNNNGSRWTIDGPAMSFVSYVSRYSLGSNTETVNYCEALNQPISCNQNSSITANIAIVQGIIIPSQNGTVKVRFASETQSTAIVAKAGASLEYW